MSEKHRDSSLAPALRSEVVPPRRRTARVALACAAGAILAVASIPLAALLLRPPAVHVTSVDIVGVHPPASPVAAEPPRSPEPQAGLPGEDFGFVVELGGASYLVLGPAADLPRSGAHLVREDGAIVGALAAVPTSATGDYGRWAGRSVVVDGTCEARVDGFAVVSLMTGSLDYMPIDYDVPEDEVDERVIAELMANDSAVAAARLDGCSGSWARGSWLEPGVAGIDIATERVEVAAREALFATAAAEAAQDDYAAAGHHGSWTADPWGTFDVRAARHPHTGGTLVVVHAVVDDGCGGADINLLGTGHVRDDGAVILDRVVETDDLGGIEALLDVDGDGDFELVGHAALGDRVLADLRGEALQRLVIPFYGCPC